MILICDVVGLDEPQLHRITSSLSSTEVLTIPFNNTDTYTRLSLASIFIESHLLKPCTFVADTKYTSILVIFDNFINDIANIDLVLHHVRTDELIFPSNDPVYKCSWLAGHPLSVIKFLSGVLELKNFKWPDVVKTGWGNPFTTIEPSYTNLFLHWANRINLKVGTLQ